MSKGKLYLLSVIGFIFFLSLISAIYAQQSTITPYQVQSKAEPGWKGKITVKFKGDFDTAYNIDGSSITPGVKIGQVTIIQSVPYYSTVPGEEMTTPTPEGFDITADVVVECDLNVSPGQASFELKDSKNKKVVGQFQIKPISGRFNLMYPTQINPKENVKVKLYSTPDLPGGKIIFIKVDPSTCTILNSSIAGNNFIQLTLNVPESLVNAKLSFWATVGTDNDYQTFVGLSGIKVIASRELKISSVTPNSAPQGSKNFRVRISGEDFSRSTGVSFSHQGIKVNSVNLISKTELEVLIDINELAAPAPSDIKVQDAHLYDTATNIFNVTEAAPEITNVNPGEIKITPTPLIIDVNGKYFTGTTNFSFSQMDIKILRTLPVNTQLTKLEIAVASSAFEGYRDLTASKGAGLTNTKINAVNLVKPLSPSPQPGPSPSVLFVPSVSSVSPRIIEKGTKNNLVTVKGNNFKPNLKVTFQLPGIMVRDLRFSTPTIFTMILDISDSVFGSWADFEVQNTDGQKCQVKQMLGLVKKQIDYKLTLLSPGVSCMSDDIDKMSEEEFLNQLKGVTEYPFFQWSSNAKKFNLFIYKALPNQTELGEIIRNRPVFQKKGIITTDFVFPLEAGELQKGVRYYWVVEAIYKEKKLKSHIWCFEIIEKNQKE